MTMRKISSLQHPLVKHFVKLQSSAGYRKECRTVVVEGLKMVRELTSSGALKIVLMTEACFERGSWEAGEIYIVSEEIIKKVVRTSSPEGIVAEAVMPEPSTLKGMKKVLVLDRVSDPGNVGTLLRSALAFGWQGVYLIEGSCDPFNDKALRAAKGATFRIPWRVGSWDDLRASFHEDEVRFLAADLEGTPPEKVVIDGRGLFLVLGHEGQGISEEALRCCEKVTIPMEGAMESLNVSAAGSILMYLFKASVA